VGLPHEVARLGSEVQAWVEQQLLEDLRHYGVRAPRLSIDWSRAVQEGHYRDFRGVMLEGLSDIDVVDGHGDVVANGWMDFVDTSDDASQPPVVFWLFLRLDSDDSRAGAKVDANLPAHVWDELTPRQKDYVARVESKWLERDPKVREWLPASS
jgi:hypothetical protein